MKKENPSRTVKVTSMLKEGVNDPEGTTIMNALHQLGFSEVTGVRVGKVVELELEEGSVEQLVDVLKNPKINFPGLGSRVLTTYSLDTEKKKGKSKK